MKKLIVLFLLFFVAGCKSVPSINEIKVNDRELMLPCTLGEITELTDDSLFLENESQWEHVQGMCYQYVCSDYNVFVEYVDSTDPKDAVVFKVMQWVYHKDYEDFQLIIFPHGIHLGMNITEAELIELVSKEYGDISEIERFEHSVLLCWGQPFPQKDTELLEYPLVVQLSEDNIVQMVSVAVNP